MAWSIQIGAIVRRKGSMSSGLVTELGDRVGDVPPLVGVVYADRPIKWESMDELLLVQPPYRPRVARPIRRADAELHNGLLIKRPTVEPAIEVSNDRRVLPWMLIVGNALWMVINIITTGMLHGWWPR